MLNMQKTCASNLKGTLPYKFEREAKIYSTNQLVHTYIAQRAAAVGYDSLRFYISGGTMYTNNYIQMASVEYYKVDNETKIFVVYYCICFES